MVQRGDRRGPWLPDHLMQSEALPFHMPYLLGVCPLPFPPAHSAPVYSTFLVCCFCASHSSICSFYVTSSLTITLWGE